MRNVFLGGRIKSNLSTLKLLLSAVALCLIGATSEAAIDSSKSLVPPLSFEASLKDEVRACPVPYSTEYCAKSQWKNSCDLQGNSILESLSLSTVVNASTKPYCPNNLLETTQNES